MKTSQATHHLACILLLKKKFKKKNFQIFIQHYYAKIVVKTLHQLSVYQEFDFNEVMSPYFLCFSYISSGTKQRIGRIA